MTAQASRDPSGFRIIVGTLAAAISALTLAALFSGCASGEHRAAIALNAWGLEPRIEFVTRDITIGVRPIVVTNVACSCAAERAAAE